MFVLAFQKQFFSPKTILFEVKNPSFWVW